MANYDVVSHIRSHTHKYTWYTIMFCFSFLAPYARTTRYEKAFFSLENQGKMARFARAPHYYAEFILASLLPPLRLVAAFFFCFSLDSPSFSSRFGKYLGLTTRCGGESIIASFRCFEYPHRRPPFSWSFWMDFVVTHRPPCVMKFAYIVPQVSSKKHIPMG